jgi:translation elongation factor EF-Ts
MSNHRIETYIHSDSATANKGGAMVMVCAKTDFACATPQFIGFAKEVAKLAYGAGTAVWKEIIEIFPDLEATRLALESKAKPLGLGERIVVDRICLFLPDGSSTLETDL